MRMKNAFYLFTAAFIWGVAFVAQSVGMEFLGPFSFNGIRSFIGFLTLLPCIAILNRINRKNEDTVQKQGGDGEKSGRISKDLLIGGICCGICLFTASSFQQVGIQYTTVGKAGFITAFYIVLVPVFGIFMKKRIGWRIWAAVFLAVIGLYYLCITGAFTIGKGDFYVFLCALVFSGHILVVDHFAPRVDGVKMSCIQFLVVGILSLAVMLSAEHPTWTAIAKSAPPLLYAGVLSCGVAYTLQILGQKNMNPAVASLILSLESCVSVLAGWVILGQHLSAREGFGCVLMFTAILLAQLPEKGRNEAGKSIPR